MAEIPYIGNELELFMHARNWKNYFGSFLRGYLKGKVLEVGAGIGSTTGFLCDGTQEKWLCLEPDPTLYAELAKKLADGSFPSCCSAIKGITRDLPKEEKYKGWRGTGLCTGTIGGRRVSDRTGTGPPVFIQPFR